MSYTAEDFEQARFAEHERIGLAVRQSTDPEYTWTSHDGGCYTDQEMAEMGWVPVREAAQSPLSLDALRTAWENAETPTGGTPIRKGDVLISSNGLDTGFIIRLPSGVDGMDDGFRILSRAHQREPWADLADKLAVEMPGIEYEPRIEGLAKALYYEHGVRVVTGGDEK